MWDIISPHTASEKAAEAKREPLAGTVESTPAKRLIQRPRQC